MNWSVSRRAVLFRKRFYLEALADVGLGGFAYASRATGTCCCPQRIATTAPVAEAIKPWGPVPTRRKHRFGLAPLLQQRCGVRNPWNRNWKSSATNEQSFEVFYDFAQVSKGTNQADVFVTRLTGAW
jgi:hypothetical protein